MGPLGIITSHQILCWLRGRWFHGLLPIESGICSKSLKESLLYCKQRWMEQKYRWNTCPIPLHLFRRFSCMTTWMTGDGLILANPSYLKEELGWPARQMEMETIFCSVCLDRLQSARWGFMACWCFWGKRSGSWNLKAYIDGVYLRAVRKHCLGFCFFYAQSYVFPICQQQCLAMLFWILVPYPGKWNITSRNAQDF